MTFETEINFFYVVLLRLIRMEIIFDAYNRQLGQTTLIISSMKQRMYLNKLFFYYVKYFFKLIVMIMTKQLAICDKYVLLGMSVADIEMIRMTQFITITFFFISFFFIEIKFYSCYLKKEKETKLRLLFLFLMEHKLYFYFLHTCSDNQDNLRRIIYQSIYFRTTVVSKTGFLCVSSN